MNFITNDPVNHPGHYTMGRTETIELITELGLGYEEGNALKYITRAGKKEGSTFIQDLEKALWYLRHLEQRYIDGEKGEAGLMKKLREYCADNVLSGGREQAVYALFGYAKPEPDRIVAIRNIMRYVEEAILDYEESQKPAHHKFGEVEE